MSAATDYSPAGQSDPQGQAAEKDAGDDQDRRQPVHASSASGNKLHRPARVQYNFLSSIPL